jgi:hypothetical protein
MQPGTLAQLWVNVDWDRVVNEGFGIEGNGRRLQEAFAAGYFTIPDGGLPGMWPVGEHLGGANVGHLFGVDGTDERSVTEALTWGRQLVREYERYYHDFVPGFERIELASTGSLPGLRETRRILGDYVLCMDDYACRAVFEDEIGRYSYPVDIHASRPSARRVERSEMDIEKTRYGRGESYGIPYRCLTPRTLDNVLVAGRCVSTDRSVHGSLRVMPGCFITGQAAGVAASMAARLRADTRAISVPELQSTLADAGAYLPNRSRGA